MNTAKKVTIDMGTVLESQLREYCMQKAVTHMRIVRRLKDKSEEVHDKRKTAKRTEEGGTADTSEKYGFELFVQLSWKEQEDILITYNSKKPRTWANLDRMTQHIDTEYQYKGTIFLQL